MKKLSISLLAIIVAFGSAFTVKSTAFANEWYILKTTETITPGTNFEQSGVSTKPINQVSRYQVSNLNGAQAERFTDAEATTACVSSFETYVCAIQLEGADANVDDQITSTELANKLSLSSYVHPQGIKYKD